ncbi:MAG: urea ABC transporter ATP-binding protein UrtD [Deltaproteobacteria bacterium]|jgi:urea transport system ATP-binding protein|nr:urea ABC transporter ATP-binding protein UrtD [Deltaproteobacteria bacterium]
MSLLSAGTRPNNSGRGPSGGRGDDGLQNDGLQNNGPPVNPGLPEDFSSRIRRREDRAPAPPFESWETKSERRSRHVLLLEDISVSFDGFKALSNLTFYLGEGELRCVIGPNGAGKTTMMDVVTGRTRPDSGEAWYGDGLNLLELDEVDISLAGIGRKFQKPSVFESLTVWRNLELALRAPKTVLRTLLARLDLGDRDYLEKTLELVRLTDQAGKPAGVLSHGQKQWLEIGMLLVQKPRILLLDEPVAGMTPAEIERTAELLLSLEGEHSLILVEHDMEFVRSVAKTVTVLHQGRVLAEGDMARVSSLPEVMEAYLGLEEE